MNYETKVVIISWLPWVARALLAGSSPLPPDDDGGDDDGDGDNGGDEDGDVNDYSDDRLTFSAVFP